MSTVPKVLYIVGRSRSGSTLLGNLLGQLDGFFHAGELRTLWSQLAAPAGAPLIRCGCGEAVRDCPVWTEVAARIFTSREGPADAATVHRWEQEIPRGRRLWRIVGERRVLSPHGSLLDYSLALRRAYVALADVTGVRVVVDISKRPTDLLLLHALHDVPSYVVHLVRDPRAVMHSWTRHVSWPGDDELEMKRFKPWQSAVSWDARNLLAEYVRRRFGPQRSLLLRYEDLVASPEATLRALLELVGEASTTSLPIHGTRTELVPGHVLGGNPSKFRTGTIEIREDNEWRQALTPHHRLLATAVALPLLRRYGYPLRTGRPA
jgi:hypothetical protein